MSEHSQGLARSIHVRLVRHAKELGVDPNLVLTRFVVERFLYRLSRSAYAERFVLKGGLLLLVWLGETIRPTRDADLLGFGKLSAESLMRIFGEVCLVDVTPDAVVFRAETIRVVSIRPEDDYGGKRITLQASLGPARLRVQVDVGIGDAVTPEPEWLDYPSLLGLPGARLRAYRPETMIAEKLHAMVVLGSRNSRMRDFFDIDMLAQHRTFSAQQLAQALRATFERRSTPIPDSLPLALTREFGESRDKAAQWRAFRSKSKLSSAPESWAQVVGRIAAFLEPALEIACGKTAVHATWNPGGPWTPIDEPGH